MKKIFFLLITVFFAMYLPAQTIVAFHEDFEFPSLGDSLVNSTDPIGGSPWAITTNLKNSGLRADSNRVQIGTTVYLTTNSFSTIGYSNVSLQFAQICKLYFSDGGQIEVSNDGGTTWNSLGTAQYQGSGNLVTSGGASKFSESAYSDWLSGDTVTKPNNSWWKTEVFNISLFAANQADVKIRFKFLGSGNPLGAGRYGWLLDDIKVFAANNELVAPRITFKTPVLKDTIYVTGPLTVNAWVKDSSLLAGVNINYSINGGANLNAAMTNVIDSLYTFDFPSLPYNSTICYSIEASDIYNNTAYLPSAGCQQVIIKKGVSTVQIGSGTLSGFNSPIYINSATTTYLYSYYAALITKTEIQSGGIIESIAFNKSDTYGYNLNNATMRIYVKNTSDLSTPNSYTEYTNVKANATKIYESTTQNLNTAAGWQTFICNTGNLLSYAGSENLMVFVEFYHPGNATGAVNWFYETVAGKASTFYGTAVVPTSTITTGQRAHIKINFESSASAIDAKVSGFTSPVNTVIANTSVPVSVKIKNLGSTILTSSKVHWSVDGVYQSFQTWTGSLDQDFISSSINLGNFSFPLGPHTIKAWTENPNNVADQNPANDTLNISIYSCTNITGVFTVGNATADYPTFNDLFTALGNCGVNGPVTFKIKTGNYQQLTIPLISNVSATNTVTFESESGNPNDVTFTYSATGAADNFVLKFDASRYVKIKNISFKATGATYGYVAVLANGASYNSMEGCKLEMPAGNTSSSMAGIYNASTFLESYNSFKNNTILNGYYGVYIYGPSSSNKEKGNVFEGNSISGFYFYAMSLYYQDSLTVIKNTVFNPSGATAYGMYSYYTDNAKYLKNKVIMNAATTNYGMYLYYNNTSGGSSLIANNFISQSVGTGTVYGLYSYYSKGMNLYNNSISVTKGTTTGYALYVGYGAAINIYNNIISNTGGGYAYYCATTTSGIDSSNYNNLYATGTTLGYWGTACASFAAFKTASGKEQNSMNVNPMYINATDLHCSNFLLGNKAKSLPEITDDIDGDIRTLSPCIGADEFPIPQNEAGIIQINQPQSMITTLNQDVKVSIQSLGQIPLTSVTVNWSVNGVMMTPYTYSGNISQFGVDSVVIANHTFSNGYSQIKVWTSLPNGLPDIFNLNDTMYKSVYACTAPLTGTFTVGGVGADYANFEAVISSLQCGISGPVVFNINPGTYTGNYSIPSVSGASLINTITFQSTNNDSTSVILQYNALGTADNYVFNFNNTGNIIIKGITLKALNATNANIITLAGTLSNISIQNCLLEGTQTANTDDNQVLIRCNTLALINGFNLVSNRMNFGRMAINFVSTTASTNVIMKYNYMYNQSAKPMNLNKIDALDFGFNQLFSDATKTGNGGIFTTNLSGRWKFYNNSLINLGGVRVWEGWVNSGSGTGQEALVYNNYLYGNVSSSYVFDGGGTYTYVKFYHNTFVGNNPTGVVVNFNNYYGCNNYVSFKNNILFSNNSTKLLHASPSATSGSPICSSNFANYSFDYNDYYTNGTTLATFNGTSCSNLAALKTATAQESHSVAINPQFAGNTDPHITNYLLKGLGIGLAEVTTDIDGQARSITTPDQGCDELQLYNNDAGILTLGQTSLCAGNTNVYAKLKNFGSNTLNNVTINWSVNGVIQSPVSFSGALSSFADSVISLGTYNYLSLTSYNVNFWTSSPNGNVDGNISNDTLKFVNLYTGLAAGTYTIGDTTANFLNLTTALNFISNNGICGPVIFNIKPGTYTGRYTISAILGASATNTITIKSLNNDSTSVILAATATATTDNWIVKLNGCQYVTIKNLKFTPLNATYANALVIANSSKNNKITGNFLTTAATGSTTDLALIRSEDVNSTDNLIVGNHTLGGSMGILIKGVSTTSRLDRVYVAKNLIEGFLQYGIRCEYANSPVIDSNIVISNLTGTTTRIGISLYYAYDSLKVIKNSLINSNATNMMGIALDNTISTATSKGLIANNFVTMLNGTTQTYALRLYPAINYLVVANNSIYVDGTSNTDTRGINPVSGGNIEVYNNNILSNKYTIFYENNCVTKSDNNNLYSTTNLYGYYNGVSIINFTSLPALITATQKDSNSVSLNPGFLSTTDLHTDLVDLYAKGKSLPQVTNDIDNQLRASIPCIGADEFTVLPNDAKLRALYTLGNLPKQAGVPHIVKAIVKNVGSTVLSNVDVTLNISGSNSFTNTKSIVSMLVGGQDTISFDPFTPVNFGVNTINVSLPVDNDISNNQLSYIQYVTDTVFGYADTSKASTNAGFGTGSGMLLAKYYVNGSKLVYAVKAFITKDNTIGKQVYAVVLNSNGAVVDSSNIKTITASDTNTWVTFNLLHPPSTGTANDYFYAGIAQITNASAYNPLGSQTENPCRPKAYYTATVSGSSLTQRTDMGRFMINAIIGNPAAKDAAMNTIIAPNSGCGLFSELVTVVIQNKGTDTIFGNQNVLSVKYGLKYNGNIINVVSQQVTDNIIPAAIKTFTFNVPLIVVAPVVDSVYHILSWTELSNDAYALNDTVYKDIIVKYTPPAPIVNPISIPYATAGTLNAISNDTVYWYANLTDTVPVSSSHSITSPILYSSVTYYAKANTSLNINANVGNGTVQNGTTTYPNPYGRFYTGNRDQYLILASELNALGVIAGPINSIGFDVVTPGAASTSGTAPSSTYCKNYTVKIGSTSSTALTTTFLTGLTQVYMNPMYQEVSGWNIHQFTSPFVWDGISNIVIETCMDKYVTASDYSPSHAIVNQTSTSFISSINYHTDGATLACPNTTGTTYSQRPNIKILSVKNGCESAKVPGVITVAPPPANEAGLLAFTNPTGPVPSNTLTQIKVMLKNYGALPLSSVKVNYKMNSVLQTPYQWNDAVNPVLPGASKELTIGSFILPGGLDTLIAWTSDPNNAIDPNPLNDTAKINFSSCMSGTFTIGVNKNYASFTAALNALEGAGICGNVVFLVDSGFYEERLFLNPITGAGPNANITFTSASGDSTKVVLHYSLSTNAAWAMKFIASSYFTFSKMTLSVSGSNTWGRIMELGPNSHHIEISNCVIEGIQPTSTSSNFALIYASGAGINYNIFKNNVMLNGSISVYAYGVSGNPNKMNVFSGNLIKDFYYQGIYAYYQDSISVIGNNMQNIAGAGTVYGLYSYYSNNHIFVKNKINITGTGAYCMYINYSNSTSGSGLIANNFISQSIGVSTAYGLYIYSSNNLNINYNSVNITGGTSTYYSFYIYGGANNNIVNNVFSNTGGGYAYYASTSTGINASDYNDLYATGSNLAYWTSAHTSLASLKATSGKDVNSINVNPAFFSVSNLHMINFLIDKKGTPLAHISDDIDGEPRSSTLPDIGADEFVLPDNDAGMTAMILPVNPATSGVQNVKAIMKNWGVLNLTSVTVNWSVNGVMQTPYPWSGIKISGEIDTINLGTYNFTAGQAVLKFWTSMPNNVNDQLTMNDTITASIIVCSGPLSGAYTVGGTSANYLTISGAVQALQMCGISGPVVFNIAAGNYNEQITIPSITGASAINTITFQSANNDSTSVILNYTASSTANNYILKLDGAKYVIIKKLKFVAAGLTYSNAIVLTNTATNNSIEENSLVGIPGTAGTSSADRALIRVSDANSSYNIVKGNKIQSGSIGIYFLGTTAIQLNGIEIRKNTIVDYAANGIEAQYTRSIIIDSNTITSSIANTAGLRNAIKLDYPYDSLKITRNKLIITANSYNANGIYIGTGNSTITAMGLIANNMLSITNGSNYTYGFRFYPASYLMMYNNSINVFGTSTSDTRGINIVSGAANIMKNNSIVCNISPVFIENAGVVTASDYNNFYTTNTANAYMWGAATYYSNFAALQTGTGMDVHSLSNDPDYMSATDLHVYTSALNNKGTVLPEITTDIDGQIRNATTPDIGADEFSPLPVDIATTSFILPTTTFSQLGVNITVKVKIKNYGADSVANFDVVCKVGNALPITYTYTNYLLSNQGDSVEFTNVNIPAGANEMKVFISLASDGNHLNDTIKLNYFGVPFKSVPYAENFDNNVDEWFTVGNGTLWEKGIPAASVINNAHSAPNVWATKLNGNYTNSNNSVLYTPIFDNSFFKADTLKFWHWVNAELNKDGGMIEYQTTTNGPWTVLGQIAPDTNSSNWYNGTLINRWTGTAAGWQESKYKVSKLTNLGNTLQFRFVFTSDATNNNNNGWAIDDFVLTLAPIPADAGVIAITSPLSSNLVGDFVTVTVTVKNFGTDTLINIPVNYQVGSLAVQTGTLAGPLAPGATSDFTFNQTIHVANVNYTLCAFTTVVGDIYIQNDRICKNVTVNPAANDVGVTEIIQPGVSVGIGGTTPIKVKIKNYGTNTQTSIPVGYQRGALPPVDAVWTGNLIAGASVEYTFPTPMGIPNGSSFSLAAYTKLVNDAYIHNDSTSKSVVICNIGTPGAITGLSNVALNASNVMYKFAAAVAGATSYNWYYSGNDVSIVDDLNNKDTVYLSFGPLATNGTLSVKAWNGTCEGNPSSFSITIGLGVEDFDQNNFWLAQNMPNPTSGLTNIEYSLPFDGDVQFNLINFIGQKVYTLNQKMNAGKHLLNLNLNNLTAGVYYYTLEFKGKRLAKKMVINK